MNTVLGFVGRLFAAFGLLASTLCLEAQTVTTVEEETSAVASSDAIEEILRQQAAAWNQGNLERFMDFYWKSNELTFSASGKVTRGWQATLDRYRQRYPDRSAMGHLAFDQLEVRFLGPGVALVIGNWQLRRPMGPTGGNFSLVMQQWEGRWVIIHDHTSVLDRGDGLDAEAGH